MRSTRQTSCAMRLLPPDSSSPRRYERVGATPSVVVRSLSGGRLPTRRTDRQVVLFLVIALPSLCEPSANRCPVRSGYIEPPDRLERTTSVRSSGRFPP